MRLWQRRLAATVVAGTAALGSVSAVIADDRSWGGIYIGANAGWAGTSYSSELRGFPGDKVSGDHDSAIAGIHVGIQHQFGHVLVGLEGAYSGAAAFSSFGDRIPGGTSGCLGVTALGFMFSCEARLHNLFTFGPRLGWTPNEHWLLYVTGGFASGRISDQVILNATGRAVGMTSANHGGWFFGGGVEYALTRNWILGLEYQHVDFDSKFRCEQIVAGGCAADESRRGNADTDIVRARLSFKLGRASDSAR